MLVQLRRLERGDRGVGVLGRGSLYVAWLVSGSCTGLSDQVAASG